VEAGVKFCTYCGAPVGGAAPAGTPDGGGDKEDAVSGVKKLFKKLEMADYHETENLVGNFLLPNDKEALLEFIIAASNQKERPVWEAKLREAFTKAQIIGGDDEKFSRRINTIKARISEKEAAAAAKKEKSRKKLIKGIIIGAAIVVVFYVVLYVGIFTASGAPEKKAIKKNEALQTEILQDIKDGNLTEAKLKAAEIITDTRNLSGPLAKTWNEKRQTLLQEIENAEKKK
jgi:hypothetical protein